MQAGREQSHFDPGIGQRLRCFRAGSCFFGVLGICIPDSRLPQDFEHMGCNEDGLMEVWRYCSSLSIHMF